VSGTDNVIKREAFSRSLPSKRSVFRQLQCLNRCDTRVALGALAIMRYTNLHFTD